MFDVPAAAMIARALSDETRLRLLAVLRDGPATVSALGERLGLPQPRVSSHLAVLRGAGLVAVEIAGRQRAYRVDPDRIGGLLDMLGTVGADARPVVAHSAPSPQAAREVQRNSALRQARTCYDHLAGVAGIELLDELLRHGWLVARPGDGGVYQLTDTGTRALRDLGVDVAGAQAARRRFAYACLDWTERRPHLGGALGAVLLRALEEAGAVERDRQSRQAVVCTSPARWLDAAPDAHA